MAIEGFITLRCRKNKFKTWFKMVWTNEDLAWIAVGYIDPISGEHTTAFHVYIDRRILRVLLVCHETSEPCPLSFSRPRPFTAGCVYLNSINRDRSYSKKEVMSNVDEQLGVLEMGQLIFGSVPLVRGHLAPVADFGTEGDKYASCSMLNIVAFFSTVNNGNWKRIEELFRRLRGRVYTGAFGNFTWKGQTIFARKTDKEVIPIPKVLFKIKMIQGKLYVVCTVNNPHATFQEIENRGNGYILGREIPLDQLPRDIAALIRAREAARPSQRENDSSNERTRNYLLNGYVYVAEFDSFADALCEEYGIDLNEAIRTLTQLEVGQDLHNDETDYDSVDEVDRNCDAMRYASIDGHECIAISSCDSYKHLVCAQSDLLIGQLMMCIQQRNFSDVVIHCIGHDTESEDEEFMLKNVQEEYNQQGLLKKIKSVLSLTLGVVLFLAFLGLKIRRK